MASRLPIVLADLPAIRELVDDEDGALIVPQRDPVAVAAAVARLLADDELRTLLDMITSGPAAALGV